MRILQAASGTTSKGPTFSSEEEKEQEIGNLFEKIMTENFPNVVKEIHILVQKEQTVSNKMNPKRPTPRHIIFKILMVKDRES